MHPDQDQNFVNNRRESKGESKNVLENSLNQSLLESRLGMAFSKLLLLMITKGQELFQFLETKLLHIKSLDDDPWFIYVYEKRKSTLYITKIFHSQIKIKFNDMETNECMKN